LKSHTVLPLKEVASGLGFPEGPVALKDGSHLVGSIGRREVLRISPQAAVSVVARIDGAPNGLAIGPDGAGYATNNGGLAMDVGADGRYSVKAVSIAPDYRTGAIDRVDLKTGAVRRLYERCDKDRLWGPNDLVFDAEGGFWFTDTGKGWERELKRGKLCYARVDGSFCIEVAFPLWMPNGIGLSPDGRTLYVAETPTARIWAFEIDAPGKLRRAEFPSAHGGRLVWQAPFYCQFDSLAVEAGGNICVATLIDGSISVVSPAGELVERVKVPDVSPTNICFGGTDMRTAYITLGHAGTLVSCEWARPGLKLQDQKRGW
jgi:gluconolactonase